MKISIFKNALVKDGIRVPIKELTINKHTIEKFLERKVVLNSLDVCGEQEMFFLVQREIGRGKKVIPHLKACIRLSNYTYLVFNLYEDLSTGELSAKALTILTDYQLRTSNNLGKGNHLNLGFTVNIKDFSEREAYFDEDNGFKDYLKKINWNEGQVILPS